jgi:hypothetical protein
LIKIKFVFLLAGSPVVDGLGLVGEEGEGMVDESLLVT